MHHVLKTLERLLRNLVIDSFLAKASPITRLFFCMSLSACIFINSYFAMGILTSMVLLIILTSLDTLKRNALILVFPMLVGFLFGISSYYFPGSLQYAGIQPALLFWKLLTLCLTALVFLVLLPEKDIIFLVKRLPYPPLWAATIGALRSVEISAWALDIVIKTRRSKRVCLYRNPVGWLDSFFTGIAGHFYEFLNSFIIAVRTRGVESTVFNPRHPVPSFCSFDVMIILCITVGLVGLIAWNI